MPAAQIPNAMPGETAVAAQRLSDPECGAQRDSGGGAAAQIPNAVPSETAVDAQPSKGRRNCSSVKRRVEQCVRR